MKAYGFIHCHSDYSLKDSTNKIEKLCLAAKEMGAKAITLTDHGVCAGHVEFLNACNAIGIKGIPGVEAYVQTDYADHAHLILLPMNYEGYQELCKAVTLSNQHMLTLGRIPSPVMNYEILESCFASGNVIASSACVNGVLSCILLHNKHILHEIDLLKRRQKKYPAPNTLEMKLLLFEIEKTSIEVEALRSEKEQTKKLAKKTYKKRLQGLASLQADSQVYIATKQKLENEMRETENAKEKLQHISAELKRKSSEVTRNKERVKKAQKSLDQWYKYESQIQEKNREIEPDGKLISMAEKELLRFQKIFKGNFYVELQYHGMEDEAYVMPILAELAYRNGVSVVATNDVHIIRPEDAEGRSYLKSLRFEKFEPVTDSDRELYLKSDTELSQKLCEIIPENIVKSAIANIRVICDKCNVDIPRVPEAQHYPVFLDEMGQRVDAPKLLRQKAYCGLKRKVSTISQKYIDRMEYELNTIIDMGYADYILIVADYVQEGKRIAKMNNPYKMGYGVGPGRGSGAGSLVNYCMGITALDPLQYNLLFERFLNKERVSMPDIDVDFSNEIRDNLIQYVMKKYGSSAVAYIRTVMTQLAKACIQNMARVRGYEMYPMPEKEQGKKSKEICEQGRKEIRRIGEELCKNISNKTGTLSENRDDILKDYETSKEHRIILDRAVSIEGTITAFSVHPAGIIIGDGKPLSSYIPMYYNTQKEQWAVSCNMVEAEEIGLLKMDFLALKNLDIISESIRRIKKNYGIEIDPEKLPFEDEVFSHIFAEGRTSFIFQFESDGMKKMLREFKPDSFEDLILLVAAYRPGPMDFIPDIIAAKHGKKETHYIIPQLKEILGTTYGQCIYQEQLMSIFHECAGFSLGQADIIRRYMSKKKVDKFLKYKIQFVDGVVLNGADRTDAEALWESLEGFARYAFNRSHAAVYALISYMTAWLKFHYPVEFMCAILNASELDRISLAVKECSTMGVSVISPDINRSEMQFSDYNGKILYGLAAIKGISSASMQEMIEERKKGKFQNYCDLLARVSIGKADMEKLIVSGALDKCGFSRTALKNAILPAFAIKNKYIKDYTTEEICRKLKEEISLSQSSDKENWLLQLNEEKELLGAYISGHPLEQFKLLKADKSITPLSHAEAEKPQIYMGVISNIKEFRQRNDGIGVTFDLEDWDGLASCIVFAQHYKQVQKYIKDGNVIKVYGYFNKQDEESFSNELITRQIFPCHPYSNHVFISFQSRTEWPDVCQSLKPYLVEQGHPVIFYECDNGSIREHLQFKGKEIFLNDDVLHLKTDAIRNIRKLNF